MQLNVVTGFFECPVLFQYEMGGLLELLFGVLVCGGSFFLSFVLKQIECSYHLCGLSYKGSNSINCFDFFSLD